MAASLIRFCRARGILTVAFSPVVTTTTASWVALNPYLQSFPDFQQVRHYAARRFTRQKKEKKKAAAKDAPEEKKEFVPYKVLLEKTQSAGFKKRSERGKKLKETPIDNVYSLRYYKWRTYSVEEAITMHRETHHPQIYNAPNALVSLHLELDVTLKKKTKCVEDFRSMIDMPHHFDLKAPRRVLVICSRPEEEKQAVAAGAHIVAGIDIVKRIQTGEVPVDDFDHVVTTPDIITELLPLKGILKRKFPVRHKRSLGFDIAQMVDFFARGVEYKSTHDIHEREYGFVEVPIGTLDMPVEHLEKNIDAAMKDVCKHRAAELGPFIRRAYLMSLPTNEQFNIPFEHCLPVDESAEATQPELATATS